MYRVYLNDILQDENDVIGIMDFGEFTIVREYGIENDEQILRDKFDVQLQFAGAAYRLFCTQRNTDYCVDITIRIDYFCDVWETIFTGIIQQKNVELSVNKCIANVTAIRDNSFSGLVRDYLNTEIGLYNTKTIACDDLTPISQTYILSSDPTNIAGSEVTVVGFDVLDVLQYYLNYITNNQINIVSDYLTATALGDVRFAITTGYNMHNTTGTLTQTHPLLSFQSLFNELRKKLKIYMGIEYDIYNAPYLRIEQESYFFDSAEHLLTITDLPADVIERIDLSLLYNQISVGSTTWEMQTGGTPDYPQEKLIAWVEEIYTNCGSCSGEKDSNLDLVSDFIIDSNVIYEALQEAAASDYANDDAVFMFHYYIDDATDLRYALITNDDVYGKDIYNEEITNELVLDKWSATSCAATSRSAAYGFSVYTTGLSVGTYLIAAPTAGGFTQQYFSGSTVFSNGGLTTAIFTNPYPPSFGTPPANDTTTYFTIPSNGNYSFKATGTFYECTSPSLNPAIQTVMDYVLKIQVYTDNTFTTLISEYEDREIDVFFNTNYDMVVETGSILLSAGNAVRLVAMTDTDGETLEDFVVSVCIHTPTFMLVNDDGNCENVVQSNAALPFVLEFKYPLCYGDYKNMKENKRGYIMVRDQPYYIREVRYRPKKLSDLMLLGSTSICSPTC